MEFNTATVLALLMRNEDVWLNMPDQLTYDEAALSLGLTGIDYETSGHAIKIVSKEAKAARVRLSAQSVHLQNQLLKLHASQGLGIIKIAVEPEEKTFIGKVKERFKLWTA